jgi:hypothetical protein
MEPREDEMNGTSQHSERGAADWGAIVSFFVLVAVIWAMWNVGPLYVADFQFIDKVEQAARAYPRTKAGDAQAHQRIWGVARELGLDEFMYESDITVEIIGTDRVVRYYYERESAVLPGWTRTFTFEEEIRQPLL